MIRSEWRRPALAAVLALVVSAGIGFAIGLAAKPGDDGPDLSEKEAFEQTRTRTEEEVSRAMARRGFLAGRRSGHDHGIVAGGMAAESDAAKVILEQRASAAQSEAASAQSELAGMTAAPAPPSSPP
ncbi:MAG: hypothetical protein J0H98_02595 [Solirubrobacterales bacterium]|nr:hypothetical protein [Solirubrobacterales bacterium]